MTESKTLSLGVASSGLCHVLGVASPVGGPVEDSVFSSSRFWHIGKFGDGEKDESPCICGFKCLLPE